MRQTSPGKLITHPLRLLHVDYRALIESNMEYLEEGKLSPTYKQKIRRLNKVEEVEEKEGPTFNMMVKLVSVFRGVFIWAVRVMHLFII